LILTTAVIGQLSPNGNFTRAAHDPQNYPQMHSHASECSFNLTSFLTGTPVALA
jgi:hypothetical protein